MSDENNQPIIEYAPPPKSTMARTLLGIFGGIIGSLLSFFFWFFVAFNMYGNLRWLAVPIVFLLPLFMMVTISLTIKSRPMLLASLITIGILSLTCGTCFAMVAG